MHELPKCKELVRDVFQNKKFLFSLGWNWRLHKVRPSYSTKKVKEHDVIAVNCSENETYVDVENCFRLGFLFLEKENII